MLWGRAGGNEVGVWPGRSTGPRRVQAAGQGLAGLTAPRQAVGVGCEGRSGRRAARQPPAGVREGSGPRRRGGNRSGGAVL